MVYNTIALSSYSQSTQDGWLACPSPHLLVKSTRGLGHLFSTVTPEDYFTALSSYSQGIQDGWLACPSLHLLAKSLGHPIFRSRVSRNK